MSSPPSSHTPFSWWASAASAAAYQPEVADSGPGSSSASAAAALVYDAELALFAAASSIFVVNLDRRPDRMEELLAHLAGEGGLGGLAGFARGDDCGRMLTRVSAVDGRTIPEEELPQNATFGTRWWNRGALGCLRSHLRILRRARAEGLAHVLVLEDDVRFTRPIGEVEDIVARQQKVPNDWHMLYLGGNHQGLRRREKAAGGGTSGASSAGGSGAGDSEDSVARVRRVKGTLTTHAYAVHRRAYDGLIALLEGEGGPVDLLYTKYQRRNACYAILPPVCVQAAGYSDIIRTTHGDDDAGHHAAQSEGKYVDWTSAPSLRSMVPAKK